MAAAKYNGVSSTDAEENLKNLNYNGQMTNQTQMAFANQIELQTVDMNIDVDSDEGYCADCTKKVRVGGDVPEETQRLSEIQQFYKGKNILITGATGEFIIYLFKLLNRQIIFNQLDNF